MRFLNSIFKLTSWKRIAISSLLLIAGILSIIFGGLFYFNGNINKTYEYNPGTKIVVKVKKEDSDPIDNLKISKSINDRLVDGFGYTGIKVEPYSDDKVIISKSGKLSQTELSNFINEITQKPSIIATSTDMQPLFYLGKFNNTQKLKYDNAYAYNIPFKKDGAEYIEQNGTNKIRIALNGNVGETEYSKATESLLNKEILIWLNIGELYSKAINEYKVEWQAANQNLWSFIHVNNAAKSTRTDTKKEADNILKEAELNVSRKYLIHRGKVYYVHNGNHVYLTNNASLSNSQSRSLVEKINFALGDYNLELFSTEQTTVNGSEQNSYLYALIGSIIAFAILAFVQIINYGLLGVVAAISSALYTILTLLIFTVVRGEYSPATLSSLLIGMVILFESSVGWFEKFKNRHLGGDSTKKSIINTSKFNSLRIIDSSTIIFVASLIIFFLGTNEIRHFSSFSVFGALIALVVSLIFLRLIVVSISTSEYLSSKTKLFGINSFSYKVYNFQTKTTINYFKNSRLVLFSFGALLLIAIIVFGTLAGLNQNLLSGFNSTSEMQGYHTVNIYSSDKTKYFFDQNLASNLISQINNSANINKLLINQPTIYSITGLDQLSGISLKLTHEDKDIINELNTLANAYSNNLLVVDSFKVTNISSLSSLQWSAISLIVSLIVILIYTAFRLGIVFSLVWGFSSIIDFLIIFIVLALSRITVNNFSLILFLIIFVWANNEKNHIFSDLKENIKLRYHKQILNHNEILNVGNYTITQNLKRFVLSFVAIIVLGISLSFVATQSNLLPTILIFISLPIILILSTYLAVFIWIKLFSFSEKTRQKRIDNGYWNVNKLDEQTFNGINDYI